MRVLSGRTRSTLSAMLALAAIIHGAACAGEGAGYSPFGILQREGFAAVTRSGTAEHEALFARPVETATDASDTAAQPSTLPDDVVFAGSALPAGQEVVTGPVATPPLPLLISSPGTAEHEALFTRPVETTTDASDTAAQPSTLPDDVVFVGSALPAGQEVVTGPVATPPSPLLISSPGTAEHEALFTRPVETTTDVSDTAAQPDDVVFAGSALPVGQEVVTGPVATSPLPLLISSPVDAVVFGPPMAGAGLEPMPDRYPGTPLTHKPTSGSTPLPAPPPEAAKRLKARARELLANGSVAPARAFLEGAAAEGDAEGEYLLAQTYDPAALSRTGVIGITGDVGKANALYRAAQLGGYTGPDNNVSAAQP